MELKTKTIMLADDKKIIVCEADASYDARMRSVVLDAQNAEADSDFGFFYKTFYPVLFACSKGDLPSASESYALPAEKLDQWYLAVWELNPDLLGEFKTEQRDRFVEFRDGSTLRLTECNDLPSIIMRLVRYESEAQARLDVPEEEVAFRNYVYPKMAACVVGEAPAVDDVVANYPHSEIAKWSAVAMDLNPKWFQLIFDEAARLAADGDAEKKKRSRRSHNKKIKSAH